MVLLQATVPVSAFLLRINDNLPAGKAGTHHLNRIPVGAPARTRAAATHSVCMCVWPSIVWGCPLFWNHGAGTVHDQTGLAM